MDVFIFSPASESRCKGITIFSNSNHFQGKWQHDASVGMVCPGQHSASHHFKGIPLHPNGRVSQWVRSRGSIAFLLNPSRTDFYVLQNIARCLFSSSKYFEHREKLLPLQGAGLPLRSRATFITCGAVSPCDGFCRVTTKILRSECNTSLLDIAE